VRPASSWLPGIIRMHPDSSDNATRCRYLLGRIEVEICVVRGGLGANARRVGNTPQEPRRRIVLLRRVAGKGEKSRPFRGAPRAAISHPERWAQIKATVFTQ
jgi:hypothetical protein